MFDYPSRVLRSSLLMTAVAVLFVVGISLDSTQAMYLFYTRPEFFMSMEKNPLAIYFLQRGIWYGLVAWEAPLAIFGIVLARTKWLMARFLSLIMAFSSVLAPLTWWFGDAASILVFYAVMAVFLSPIMLKTRLLISCNDRICLTDLLKRFLCLLA
jgi:hypothetical protein